MIQKGLGAVPHTGGAKFHRDDYLYNTLIRWINAGAPQDPPTVAHADSLEILPKQMLLEGEGARQQMTIRAHYSDGTDRDVTTLGAVPEQQRKLGEDRRRRQGDAPPNAARRSSWPASRRLPSARR